MDWTTVDASALRCLTAARPEPVLAAAFAVGLEIGRFGGIAHKISMILVNDGQ